MNGLNLLSHQDDCNVQPISSVNNISPLCFFFFFQELWTTIISRSEHEQLSTSFWGINKAVSLDSLSNIYKKHFCSMCYSALVHRKLPPTRSRLSAGFPQASGWPLIQQSSPYVLIVAVAPVAMAVHGRSSSKKCWHFCYHQPPPNASWAIALLQTHRQSPAKENWQSSSAERSTRPQLLKRKLHIGGELGGSPS